MFQLSEDGASTLITLLPVSIEVFYEALCPDSRSFLLTQLLPTYNKIPEAMNVQLIPYGKAKVIIHKHDWYLSSCRKTKV